MQTKIQNSWGKAAALMQAFHEFQHAWQNLTVTPEVETWFNAWSESLVKQPALTDILMENLNVPKVTMKASVRDAVLVMKQCRQTAVLVMKERYLIVYVCTDLYLASWLVSLRPRT